MGHCICALIGPLTAMRDATARVEQAYCVALTDDLGIVPMTEELFDALNDFELGSMAPFVLMTPKLRDRWQALLGETPFGYIETDYFGGTGTQCGGAWSGTVALVDPLRDDNAVDLILRTLGVVRKFGLDEWDTVDLRRFRSMDAFQSAAS